MKKLSGAILFAFCFLQLSAQFNTAKMDSLITAIENNNKLMGSITLMQDGKQVYSRAFGYADVAQNRKADVKTKYRIGSITKTFTAALIMKAVELKKLSLSQTIDKWFPKVKNAKTITVEQLLMHRSGIYNLTDSTFLSWNTKAKSEKELLAMIEGYPSNFTPGSKYEYSNSNYILLTFILQNVFKKHYKDLLTQYITKPLGLKDTYVSYKANSGKNETYSYTFADKWEKEPDTDLSIALGAGSIVSTTADLAVFSHSLFTGKILSAKSVEQMKTLKDNYGYALTRVPFYDKKGYGHTGGIDGCRSSLFYFPDSKRIIAINTNGQSNSFSPNDLAIGALSILYEKPYEIPQFKTVDIAPEQLDKLAGTYASTALPLKITITAEKGKLKGQATGQPSFPLEAVSPVKFEFKPAGVVLVFDPEKKEMTLFQGGGEFLFSKE